MKSLRDIVAIASIPIVIACGPEQTLQDEVENTEIEYTLEGDKNSGTLTANAGDLETTLQGNFNHFLNPPEKDKIGNVPRKLTGQYRIKVNFDGKECYVPRGEWDDASMKKYEETPKCNEYTSQIATKALQLSLQDAFPELVKNSRKR